MRDVLGKVLPGFIWIIFLTNYLVDLTIYDKYLYILKTINLFNAIIIFTFSYLVGMGIQYFGQILELTLINEYKTNLSIEQWVKLRSKFLSNADAAHLKNGERLSIIKEASGNNGTSILLSVPLFTISNNSSVSINQKMIIILFLLILSIILIKMNRSVWNEEKLYMELISEKRKPHKKA